MFIARISASFFNKRKTLLAGIVGCLLVLTSSAFAQERFENLFQSKVSASQLQQLIKQLAPSEATKGQFTQYRQLKVLKKPLVSRGEFLFSKDLGIIWHQTQPFNTTLILKQNKLVQIDSQGKIQVSDSRNNAAASAIGEIMPTLLNALLSGNLAKLTPHFKISLQQAGPSSQWQLGLIPLDPIVSQAIPKMVLAGHQQIQTLWLLGHDGDSSRIEFTELKSQPLSADDQAKFSVSEK